MGVITHLGPVNAAGKHLKLVRSLLKEDSDVTWGRSHSSCAKMIAALGIQLQEAHGLNVLVVMDAQRLRTIPLQMIARTSATLLCCLCT